MGIKDALLPEFDHEMGTTRRLLERLPEQALSWKPHPKSMSLGGLATHLTQIPVWVAAICNDLSYDLATAGPPATELTSRADILTTFDRHVAQARAQIDGKSDAELMAPWSLKHGDREIFTLPRAAALRSFLMNHSIHHRGQLSVYLRLNDVPLPSIYGPSADEPSF